MAPRPRGHTRYSFQALGVIAFIGLALMLCCLFSRTAGASDQSDIAGQTVRVGIVEQQGIAMRDANGVVRGFDAEYLSKISQYGNFHIEYEVYDDFSELLVALEDGTVQMVPGLSKTDEREARFLFSDNPISSGTLFLCVRADDDRYEFGNVNQVATMRIGTEAGSITYTKALEWAQKTGIELNLIEYSGEEQLKEALLSNEVDGAFIRSSALVHCREILSLDLMQFYVAFNSRQIELKKVVDSAANRINYETPLYTQYLESKYMRRRNSSLTITASEKEYLENHASEPIKVATITNDAPYYFRQNGNQAGIVPDYYAELAETIAKTGASVSFDFVEYPTLEEAISAVSSGEAEVLGVTCIDATTASEHGLLLTSSYQMQNIASVAKSQGVALDVTSLEKDGTTVAAVLNSERDTFRAYLDRPDNHFELVGYPTLDECYEALQSGEADIVATSSARSVWLINQHRSGTFYVSILTEANLPICAAVAADNPRLGSILSHASVNTDAGLSTIIAQNTMPSTDLFTFLNRTPAHILVILFIVSLAAVSGITFGINRYRHAREIKRKNGELIRAQQDLLHSYETDALTGLPNRATALRNAAIRTSDECYSLMLLSIDNLDTIIESFGHRVQQQVVLKIAERLSRFCAAKSQQRDLYRYDVDKFLLVLHDCKIDSEDPRAVEVRLAVRKAIMLGTDGTTGTGAKKTTIWPKPSIGIAASNGTEDPEHVMRNSVMALDEAQRRGHPFIYAYAEELHTQLERQNTVQETVEKAVASGSFYMLYQPQVNLLTREVRGYEALVRIVGSDISPTEFIPIAEANGLISSIGRITTELVVRQLAAWRDEGRRLLPVSINFSSLQIGDAGYLNYLLGLLKRYDIDSSLVEIEITESLLARKNAETELLFSRMRDAGIKILMDDFGTGYSSISYLAYIPIDIIKIDKSIVDAFLTPVDTQERSGSGNAFVHDLIRLTHDLGKTTIIEGIEDAWQVDALASLGCDAIQGFYFSRPLTAEDAPLYHP